MKVCPVHQEFRLTGTYSNISSSLGVAFSMLESHSFGLHGVGPFLGHMFLVLVDAHSKWIDVNHMQSILAAKTIEKLRIVFATHGLVHKVVTDNVPSLQVKSSVPSCPLMGMCMSQLSHTTLQAMVLQFRFLNET